MIKMDIDGRLWLPTLAQPQQAERCAMSLARTMRGWGLRRRQRLPPTRPTSTSRDRAPTPRHVWQRPFAPTRTILNRPARRHDGYASLAKAWVVDSGWSHGVTVSTLDPESSDRGSNPRETFDRAIDSERRSGGTPLEHVDVVPRALVKDACAAAAGEGASLALVRDGVNSVAPDRSR